MDNAAPAFTPYLEENWMNFENYDLKQLLEQDLLLPPPAHSQLNTPAHTPAYDNEVEVRAKTDEKDAASASQSRVSHDPLAPAPNIQSVDQLPPSPPLTFNFASVKEEHPPPPMDVGANWMNMDLGPDFVHQAMATELQQGAAVEQTGHQKQKVLPPPPPTRKNADPENPLGLNLYQLDPKSIKNLKFRKRVEGAIQSRKYREEQKCLAKTPKCMGLCKSGTELLNQLKSLQAALESQPRPENFEWSKRVKSIVVLLESQMT